MVKAVTKSRCDVLVTAQIGLSQGEESGREEVQQSNRRDRRVPDWGFKRKGR